jgi:NADPH2:quinone reductase
MRAIVIDRFGGSGELRAADLPRPEPQAGEVLVRVACAGVNPADWKTREGLLARYIDYRFPFVLGFDVAGVVESVGPGVETFKPGDRVFGTSMQGQGVDGSYAEYTRCHAALLAPMSAGLAFAEAAALPTAGTTAYGSLIDAGALRAGQTVLIHGGAGGVGGLAIQIARAAGARVAVTCSAAKIGYVRSLGAELAIDYRTQDVAAAVRAWMPDGVDLVLDAVGLDTLAAQASRLVKRGGRFVEVETLLSAASDAQKAEAAAHGVTVVSNMVAVARLPMHLASLACLVAEGGVRPPPIERLPLGDAALAHERVQSGQVRGKLVLEVDQAQRG